MEVGWWRLDLLGAQLDAGPEPTRSMSRLLHPDVAHLVDAVESELSLPPNQPPTPSNASPFFLLCGGRASTSPAYGPRDDAPDYRHMDAEAGKRSGDGGGGVCIVQAQLPLMHIHC